MRARESAATHAPELAQEELAYLLDLVKNYPRGRCLEIGTAAGGTLCAMMTSFSPSERPQFVVIDPMTYFRDQLKIVAANIRRNGLGADQVDLRVSTSADAFPEAAGRGESFDFIFVDGAHKIRYVTQDLRWTRLLRVGGTVCFHDYGGKHKAVTWAVDRWLRKHPNYRRQALKGTLLSILKETGSSSLEIGRGDEYWAAICSPYLQLQSSLAKRLRRS